MTGIQGRGLCWRHKCGSHCFLWMVFEAMTLDEITNRVSVDSKKKKPKKSTAFHCSAVEI